MTGTQEQNFSVNTKRLRNKDKQRLFSLLTKSKKSNPGLVNFIQELRAAGMDIDNIYFEDIREWI